MAATAAAVCCSGVSRRFGSIVAVDGADLAVPAGALTVVLGPSGCGKSTLLRLIAGFDRPDAGTISVGGQVVASPDRHVPPERRGVAVVPQEQALFPHLDVAENVGYGLARRSAGRRARIEEMLELTGLGGLGRRMPFELSGGQQQRVALARALAPAPAVILLDEPFASLDADLRVAVRNEVANILRQVGGTAVMVTHDREEALSMADLLVVMSAGRVAQADLPETVYRRPADPVVAALVGPVNLLLGRASGPGRVSCALGDLRCGEHGDSAEVRVLVRPEQVRLSAPDGAGDVAGVLETYQFLGTHAIADVILADGTRLAARWSDGRRLEPGQGVTVGCTGEVMCFPVEGVIASSHI